MKGKLIEDFDSNINDFFYKKGEVVNVTEISGFEHTYAVYRDDTLDWIPKGLVKII